MRFLFISQVSIFHNQDAIQAVFMHTGINAGLVVTGKIDMDKGTHGVAGETVNLVTQQSSLAEEGEILVGMDAYRQAEGYFTFKSLEPTPVKGNTEPIQVIRSCR